MDVTSTILFKSRLASDRDARAIFELTQEKVRPLTSPQALTLARAAHDANPSPANRSRLMHLLSLNEGHAEMEERFADATGLAFQDLLLLAYSTFAQEDPSANRRVVALCNQALAVAADRPMRAAALATRAKAEIRLGEQPVARATLAAALDEDPANKDACKRLAALDLAEGRIEHLLGWTGRLVAQGIAHSRLLAAHSLALARLGPADGTHQAADREEFHIAGQPPVPAGWANLAELNAAVAEELLTHPDMLFDRYGSASSRTWRVEHPGRPDRPAIGALTEMIIDEIKRRVAMLGSSDHPWAIARPDRAWLRTWAVITEGDGFENWHVHQFGWLSGVYYVRVPQQIAQGNSKNGCIAFGLPEELAGKAAAERHAEQIVRPQEGLMLTFPSHAYHRTYPHETSGKRICFAFDVRPIE